MMESKFFILVGNLGHRNMFRIDRDGKITREDYSQSSIEGRVIQSSETPRDHFSSSRHLDGTTPDAGYRRIRIDLQRAVHWKSVNVAQDYVQLDETRKTKPGAVLLGQLLAL